MVAKNLVESWVMTEKTMCRLCVCMHEEYKSLYDDDSGQGNNVYEITLKYFDPMLLTPESGKWDSTVICLSCWHHIDDFHGFQQTILQTQSNLQRTQLQTQEDIKETTAEIKTEDMLDMEDHLLIKMEDIANKEEFIYSVSNGKSLSDIESQDIIQDDINCGTTDEDEDDMKPLIYHIKKFQDRQNIPSERNKNQQKKSSGVKQKKSRLRRKIKLEDIDKESTKNSETDELPAKKNLENSNNEVKSCSNKTVEWDNFIAQWKNELECLHCTATVTSFTLLRKHFRAHHPKEKLYAKCCDRRFSKRFTLFEHIQLHLNPEVFKCDECGKCSTSSSNLSKHKKELHTDEGKLRPFECNVCKKNFTSKTNLRIHMEVHESSRNHICKVCGKGFPSEQRRKTHERMVHNVDRICDQCGKSVHGIYALRQHLLEHKGIQKTKWPCDICGAQLNSHSSRKRHKQMRHNDGTTAYICSDCGKVYTSEPALMAHKRMAHARELNFKCNYCEKAFKTARNLREHTATHTGIDIYQCPHCPKTFKMSSNMHHHRKKVHPIEWAAGRANKRSNKINLSLVSNEVVI